ncbi:MAG: glycosyltransferase [Planctomycetota bacterium]
MSKPLRVAYLTSAFARPSDTFVRSEVDRLRGMGLDIETFSIRRPEVDANVDANVAKHQGRTDYILETGMLQLFVATIACFFANPLRFSHTKILAWQTCSPGLRSWCLHVVYLMEAAYLAQQIRKRKLDHIHNHIGENSATVAMLAASLADVPYSLTIHGPAIFTAPQRWALGMKLDRAAFTACISHFCRSQCMLHSQPSTWQRLHVVRCAVGEAFLEEPRRLPTNPPTIVCVGRLCVDKAQRLLVEAAATLAKEGIDFRLKLIGDGPERQAIEAVVRRENLSEVVELAGWQSSEEIKEVLQQATALALPSFAEGLPIVIMEALALQCPVISTNIAAIAELVEAGQSGWLLPPGNVDAIVDALRNAVQASDDELARMGAYGREKVLRLHHPEPQAARLRQLICEASTA